RPDLLAVDDEVVAGILRARAERGEVGARVGLGVTLAPADLAADDLRQVLALLLLGAVFQQRGPEHPDTEGIQRAAAAEGAHLGGEDARFRRGQPAAAVLARPGGGRPATLGHALEPEALRLGLERPLPAAPAAVGVVLDGLSHLGRTVGFEPCARLAPEICERSHFCLS